VGAGDSGDAKAWHAAISFTHSEVESDILLVVGTSATSSHSSVSLAAKRAVRSTPGPPAASISTHLSTPSGGAPMTDKLC